MPGVMLYLNKSDFKLYQALPEGKASQLFSQALHDNAGELETIEDITRKITSMRKEQEEVQEKIAKFEKRKAEFEEKEKVLLASKDEIERRNKQRITDFLASWNEDFKAVTGRDMIEADIETFRAYVDAQQEEGRFMGMYQWLDSLKK